MAIKKGQQKLLNKHEEKCKKKKLLLDKRNLSLFLSRRNWKKREKCAAVGNVNFNNRKFTQVAALRI